MNMVSILQRLIASSFCLLLLSCSTTRDSTSGPTEARELSRSVLVIREGPDGQLTHAWEPARHFDLAQYPARAMASGAQGHIVRAAWTRDCDEENDACIDMCVQARQGRNWSHASDGSKNEMCRKKCWPAYNDCNQLRDQAGALKFQVIDEALDWLKQHREELVAGTVVVIAGVAFVVIVAGSGGAVLILAPAVLLVSSGAPSGSSLAAVKP
jgi:hypothetical protein